MSINKSTAIILSISSLFSITGINAQTSDSAKSLVGLYETWDSGFVKNNWNVVCDDWNINLQQGNPEPCVVFSTDTNELNYSCILESDDIYLNSEIYGLNYRFQFEYRLQNINPTHTEKLIIQLWELNQIFFEDTLSNGLSTNWVQFDQRFPHEPSGLPITIKFIATGENYGNINSWQIDNIQLRKCSPAPNRLKANVETGTQFNIIHLDWGINLHPGNGETIGFNDGTFENGFASTSGGYGLCQLFSPEHFPQLNYRFYIYAVRYYNFDYGNYDQEELVYILDGQGNEILAGPYSIVDAPPGEWVHLDVDVVRIDSGSFMMATINTEGMGPFIGVDQDNSFYYPTLHFGQIGDWTVLADLGPCCYVGSHEAIIYYGPWAPPVSYNIYRKFPGESFVKVNDTLVDESKYTDTITQNTLCTYYVTAVYEGCESDSSNNVVVESIVGIENYSGKPDILTAHPNPADDMLEFSLPALVFGNYKVLLYDISGRKAKVKKFASYDEPCLEVYDLEEGVYILELQWEDNIYSCKVLVRH